MEVGGRDFWKDKECIFRYVQGVQLLLSVVTVLQGFSKASFFIDKLSLLMYKVMIMSKID